MLGLRRLARRYGVSFIAMPPPAASERKDFAIACRLQWFVQALVYLLGREGLRDGSVRHADIADFVADWSEEGGWRRPAQFDADATHSNSFVALPLAAWLQSQVWSAE